MDISKLKHHADFNLKTEALGTVRCGPCTTEDINEADRGARTMLPNGEALAVKLLLSIARRLAGSEEVDSVCGGPALTEDEVAHVTRAELDKFSEEFIARRLRPRTEQAGSSVKAGCELLPEAIIAHTDSQRAQMKEILAQSRSNILGGSSLDAVRKALGETSIEEQFRKFGIGDAFKNEMRAGGIADAVKAKMRAAGVGDAFKDHILKLGIGESATARMRKDLLGASAMDAAISTFKASDNLGKSIAALRATDAAALQPTQIHAHLPTFKIPPNPILETNKLLRKQQSYAEEIRPVIIRCAELIQTLTVTTLATQNLANENAAQAEKNAARAEKHAARSMLVAIGSILIAVITSAMAIYYARISPSAEQIDKLAKAISNQMAASDASATAERTAATVRAMEDRAELVAAISQRSPALDRAAHKSNDPGVNHGVRAAR